MDVTDRLFRVVVLGGIALTAAPVALAASGCGGSLKEPAEAGAEAGADGGFPQETASFLDTGTATEASAEASTADGSTDGSVDASDACFPQETALPPDAACGR